MLHAGVYLTYSIYEYMLILSCILRWFGVAD